MPMAEFLFALLLALAAGFLIGYVVRRFQR
jgi:NhaP-type Na+/H+ or K+/H+ antiporter